MLDVLFGFGIVCEGQHRRFVEALLAANGAEKVTLAYNDDGSTTVTNEYGKQATYRFQVIQGLATPTLARSCSTN